MYFNFLLSVLLYFGFTSTVLSQNLGDSLAKVVQVSSSKRTLVLDRGTAVGFKNQEIAYLLGSSSVKIKGAGTKRVYYPVAKIKLIKERVKSSIWIVLESFKKEISEKEKYLFFTLSDFLKGRTPIKLARQKIITNKKDKKENLYDSMSKEDHKLSRKKQNYHREELEAKNADVVDYDIKLLSVDELRKKEARKVGAVAIVKGPKLAQYRKRKDLATFDKMIHLAITNANAPKKYNSENAGVYYNEYEKKKLEDSARSEKVEKVTNLYLKKGASWSDDLSDEDLSRVLHKVGELKEVKRRQSITATQFENQFYLSFAAGFISNEVNTSKAANISNISYLISSEFFILKDFQSLKSFTFELEGRYAKAPVSVGGFNAEMTEYSVAGYLNWYPYLSSSALNENIIFLSAGFRTGFSTLFIQDISETGRYQALVFPGIRAGIKYNFSNSYGARFFASLESVKLGKTGGSTSFASSTSYTDGRVGVSLSKFY